MARNTTTTTRLAFRDHERILSSTIAFAFVNRARIRRDVSEAETRKPALDSIHRKQPTGYRRPSAAAR
jgi:hypothetical protein